MKNAWSICFVATLSFIIFSCASSAHFQEDSAVSVLEDETSRVDQSMMGSPAQVLANTLRRQPGVIVENNIVRIRGGYQNLLGIVHPLFVVNGHVLGNEFDKAAEVTYGQEIKNVRVLKDGDAAFYGSRGASGVIEIYTD